MREHKVLNINAKQMIPCFKEYGVIKAAIFGSQSRGTAMPDSDVDVIVSFGRKYDLFDLSGLRIDLEAILRKPVDIITYDALDDDFFSQTVRKEGTVIYEEPSGITLEQNGRHAGYCCPSL